MLSIHILQLTYYHHSHRAYELFKKHYSSKHVNVAKSSDMSTITSITRSKLDADFDYMIDDETDEVTRYLGERLEGKDTNVLNWWKVGIWLSKSS
jgi:hypothetical protein